MQQIYNHLESPLANKINANGDEYLYFGGTAYLGIPQNKDFIKLYIEGVERYGLNNGTSRGNNVQLGIYNEAEDFTAAKYGAKAALITSSGYLAAKIAVRIYAQQAEVRYAPNTHPALWIDGNPNSNSKFVRWSEEIVREINSSENKDWLLLSNSINNLLPEIYDFNFITKFNSGKNITLIIDDSHGIGLLNGGNSALQHLPKNTNVEIIVVASMAKALGIDAGVILGDKKTIAKLKESDEFYGASPPAAAGLYAFIHADDVYHRSYEKLQENVKLLKQQLTNKNEWHFVEDFPVFLSKQPAIEQRLLEQKILISSFPYPDRNGKNLNRIVLSSWHSETDILKLIAAVG
ncbi:MAG: aminotransferase class I/II-fold pyridoxal phosphate-dependent enzyme [Flavobacteriales bacterium]|nr:MAG: aminotransferase class I/II-fold pyridoxal phosphate-dependent enzyme [Flavobacteriales bacterium]